jgi:tetrahydromethanopterin S-methyltransferase subunit G
MSNLTPEQERQLEDLVLTKLMRFNATVIGIVLGIILGLVIFFATNWLVIKGGDVIGPNMALLGHFLIGYRVTFWGSLIGLLYGFVIGFVIGFVFASLYNWIAGLREEKS